VVEVITKSRRRFPLSSSNGAFLSNRPIQTFKDITLLDGSYFHRRRLLKSLTLAIERKQRSRELEFPRDANCVHKVTSRRQVTVHCDLHMRNGLIRFECAQRLLAIDRIQSTAKQQSFNRIKRQEVPAKPAGGIGYRPELISEVGHKVDHHVRARNATRRHSIGLIVDESKHRAGRRD